MTFLYEEIEALRKNGYIYNMPKYIPNNLNKNFELRPYQIKAFENFITHFKSKNCSHPTQLLFHMATGSGKTLIMAGLMLYLYKKGYRNFLFFVNLSAIVKKTEDNFLNTISNKYLFADEIVIDGEHVPIKKVENFQDTNPLAINICFSTTQGLHTNMKYVKENGISLDDFENRKTVLISDEAHHLNVDTKKLNKNEQANTTSWEYTVKNIFNQHKDNVLLEFTATCDLNNSNICEEYKDKIIFDYPLSKFYSEKYSKEIKTLRSDVDVMDRAIQALVLSQYRLKVFQDNCLSVKPVVLFKSAKIADSKDFMANFIKTITGLQGTDLQRIANLINSKTMNKAYEYFKSKNISFDMLAQELKVEFSQEHCLSVNDDKEADAKQTILNSLESLKNPYRAIFEVKKLDEGWDVLNLFDIVRLYETRQSGKKISPSTISEAQLIGRGSRYYPFMTDNTDTKFQRKYDDDVSNELRICEELYYHCQNDSRYIAELHTALKTIGIDLTKKVIKRHQLKESFINDELYKTGIVFANKRIAKKRTNITNLNQDIDTKLYRVTISTGESDEDIILADNQKPNNNKNLKLFRTTIKDISNINYAIVHKQLAKFPIFKFNNLKKLFPNLTSTREFITSENYLGSISIEIYSKCITPSIKIFNKTMNYVLQQLELQLSNIEDEYIGSPNFYSCNINTVFKNKDVNYTEPKDGGLGVSQNDKSVPDNIKIDLSKEDWFAFTDNYGTSEEKAFVAYFKSHIDNLQKQYDKIYLIRNERQLCIYSFNDGNRFEPDYVLLLQRHNETGFDQFQIFIEPKGEHITEFDKWKEDFLLTLKDSATPKKVFADDNNYFIWGFHFFNNKNIDKFDKDFYYLTQ